MSQFKHATAASTDVEWSWERLTSEQHDVLDAAWSALVVQPKLATKMQRNIGRRSYWRGMSHMDLIQQGQHDLTSPHLL